MAQSVGVVVSKDFPVQAVPSACDLWPVQLADGPAPAFLDQSGAVVAAPELADKVVGVVTSSATSAGELGRIEAAWLGMTGLALPAIETVADPDDPQAVFAAALKCLAADRDRYAELNVRYSRELVLLRQQHQTMQESFERLERFVQESPFDHRRMSVTLAPSSPPVPIRLAGSGEVVQRLPAATVGLSDVALWIEPAASPRRGLLTVDLLDADSGLALAGWEVTAGRLRSGWNRFSLERALGPDPMTVHLRARWSGEGDLALLTSTEHPDDRFGAVIDGKVDRRVLALKTWVSVAGLTAPLAAGSHVPRTAKSPVRHIGADYLLTAINTENHRADLPFVTGARALLLHAPERSGQVRSCFLPDAVDRLAREVIVDVRTRHPDAPRLHYAVAVSPLAARPSVPGVIPRFDPAHVADWVEVGADEDAQVRLVLPEPLEEPHDLWLMVRLVPEKNGLIGQLRRRIGTGGKPRNAFGWSSISAVTIKLQAPA